VRRLVLAIPVALVALALAVPAFAENPTVQIASDPKLGNILVDSKGMTLYLYTRDEPNVSNCYDQCATNWPPLIVTAAPTGPANLPGKLGTTTRKDGKMQVTYDGKPLYLWIRDTKPGDTTGQGVNNVWYVIPVSAPATTAAAGGLPRAGDVSLPTIAAIAVALGILGLGTRLLLGPRLR